MPQQHSRQESDTSKTPPNTRSLKDEPNLQVSFEQILKDIVDDVSSLRYGSVQVQVKHGQVVQVERSEKRRYPSKL